MISVESLTIQEFRGIRDLTLTLNGKNFAVCGRNGTGKSGVVDALEFVLTGNISRLSGEGKGEVSVEKHAPHVDVRNNPEKAKVSAVIVVPGEKLPVTIERTAKNPATYKLTPHSAAAQQAIDAMVAHPEIVLSRRELIRYVLATPGKRAEEVRALLHLDSTNDVRLAFGRIAKECSRTLERATTDFKRAKSELMQALEVTALKVDLILPVVNGRRATLGLPAFETLTAQTVLKDGIASAATKPQRLVKAQAVLDLQAFHSALETIRSEAVTRQIEVLHRELTALSVDPAARTGVTVDNFYRTGLALIDEAACPFCDTAWSAEELKLHVAGKLKRLEEAAKKRQQAETKIRSLMEEFEALDVSLEALARHGAVATPPQRMPALRAFRQKQQARLQDLENIVPFASALQSLADLSSVDKAVLDEIAELQKIVEALPEPSKEQEARDWLTMIQLRWEAYIKTRLAEKTAKERADLADKASEVYGKTCDRVLTDLYCAVEKQFSEFYRFINRDDEATFEAKLAPSLGKLGFNVDFYGRGFFPPGAYHSEGHQDSMGLCLYLALMQHLHGQNFNFTVLDDVLMSVDAGHRREVCALIKKYFPSTQFVMTTHDHIWLQHMRRETLVTSKNTLVLRGWDVAQGPTQFDDRDVWREIDDHLAADNVRAAAGALRHHLEYMATELCHALHAQVGFRADASYQLGELMPAAMARLRKLYASGKAAAQSWNQRDVVQALGEREDAFAKLMAATQVEAWQVNSAIHYNAWDNLQKNDFAPVAAAFKALLEGFRCEHCDEHLAVSPDRETPESLRCGCGRINVNLLKKNSS